MAARSPRRREGSAWLRAAVVLCFGTFGLVGLTAPAVAQLDSPAAIQVTPGCQQYTLTWQNVAGAAAYRVYVTGVPTPIEVLTESAVFPVTSAPTNRTFRVSTVDANDVEGPQSGPRQGTGAGLPFSLQALPDITVHVGDVLSFMVSLVGQPGVPAPLTSYEWTRDGVPFIHPSSTYFTSTAQLSDGGLYHLRGCTECCDELDLVRVTVLPNALPPPQNVAAQTGCLGASVTWDSRPGAASYVVHRSGTTDVSVLTNSYFDPLSTGVCRSYSVSTVDAFSQTGGSSGNTPERCGVAPLPASLSLGADQIIRVNRPFSLVLPGTFDLASTTFNWRKNNVSLGALSQPTFSIANVVVGSAGSYTCVVSNVCGSVTSSAVVLTVVVPPPPPTSVTASVTACRQVTITWSAAAGALKYFISRSPQFPGTPVPPLPPGFFVNGTTYVDTAAPADSSISYTYQVASVGLGDITGTFSSSTAALRPAAWPRPGNPINGATVEVGSFVNLRTTVIGTSAVWRKNGVTFTGGFQDVHPIGSTQLSVTLSLSSVSVADAGSYNLQVCTACGCVNTTVAVVKVCNTPAVTTPAQVLASEGQASVDLVATTSNAVSMQWYKGNVALAEGAHFTGTTTGTLTIHTPLTADAGFYQLQVVGNCGTVNGPLAELVVSPCIDPPVASQQPAATQAVLIGAPASITFVATCCRTPDYQWYKIADTGPQAVAGATASVLSIPSFSANDVGVYFCVASNRPPSAISNFAQLTELIPPPPAIFTRFSRSTECGGSTLRVSTNVPLSFTVISRRGTCSGPIELQTTPTPLVRNLDLFIPIPDPAFRCVLVEARDAANVLVLPGNIGVWARQPGPQLNMDVVAMPDYVSTPFGIAVALQVTVRNAGCDAYTGDLTILGADLASLASPALLLDGSPAAGTVLLPGGLAVGQTRSFPLIYFPAVPPDPGTTLTRDLTVAVEMTQPVTATLTYLGLVRLTPTGVQ